jgi:threonine dehydratase
MERPIPEEARRLVRVTPLIYAPPLGCYLKLESLQATGSFKLRGAALKLARLPMDERARGVVTASAGNHGLGVALAAKHLGIRATVVVSRGAAAPKKDGIARLGAEIRQSAGDYDQAEREARALAAGRGSLFVSAYDDDDVIDGNGGWLAQELLSQHATLRRVIVPVGGGGLAGGLARELAPRGVQVIGVQPRANCAMHDSLAEGRALTTYTGSPTLCEGLEGAVAQRTYELARAHLDSITLVDEPEVRDAIVFAWRGLALVVEPSAAVVLAAARSGRLMLGPAGAAGGAERSETIEDDTALVITGSNLDPALLDELLMS